MAIMAQCFHFDMHRSLIRKDEKKNTNKFTYHEMATQISFDMEVMSNDSLSTDTF